MQQPKKGNIAPKDEVREYDPERRRRIAKLRRMCTGLRSGDVLEFQRAQQKAMGGK